MERLLNLARGCVRMEFTGAEPEELINRLALRGIPFWSPEKDSVGALRVTVLRRDVGGIQNGGFHARIISERGLPKLWRALAHRWILLIGAAAIAALMLWSSVHIWQIDVSGNETVPTWRILSALDSIGVGIGTNWLSITQDNVRSEALLLLPELKWLTVNISGSRAEVIVREREDIPAITDRTEPTDVVASVSGIVSDMSILSGTKLVTAGQTVLAGETLVSSGITNLAGETRLVNAQASVIARTWHTITAKSPLTAAVRIQVSEKKRRFALILGTKRINFYKSSGIYTTGCDKIILEHKVSCKGLFSLPVSVIEIRTVYYDTEEQTRDEFALRDELITLAEETLHYRIGDNGEVVQQSLSGSVCGKALSVTLRAEARQDIAQSKAFYEGVTDND